MTSKTTAWNELHLAENPAVELLQFLGYTYVTPEALEPERTNFKGNYSGKLSTARPARAI